MRTFDFDGTPCPVDVPALEIGDSAPDFALLDSAFSEVTLAAFHGARKVLLTVPGVDVKGPAEAARTLASLTTGTDVALLIVSRDTPLALARFAAENHLGQATMLSGFRAERFGPAYGVEVTDGRYTTLYASALFVVDENDTIVHHQFIATLNTQPDVAALAASLGLDLTEAS